jgi:hypothetical protein
LNITLDAISGFKCQKNEIMIIKNAYKQEKPTFSRLNFINSTTKKLILRGSAKTVGNETIHKNIFE